MSKSKGNFYRLDDIIARGYVPTTLRLLFLSSHYRSQLNFTWQFDQAESNLARIENWITNLEKNENYAKTKNIDIDG